MMQSNEINELVSALAKAQSEISPAIKDSLNPHFKSKYADLSSVWEACRGPLSKNGLAVIQTTEMIADKLTVVTTLAHSSGQWMKSHLPVLSLTNTPQALGSALTYMRRYSLSAITGVAPGDDDDGEAAMVQASAKKQKPLINAEQLENLLQTLERCNQKFVQTVWEYLSKINIHQLDQLPVEVYERIIFGASRNIQDQAEHEENKLEN